MASILRCLGLGSCMPSHRETHASPAKVAVGKYALFRQRNLSKFDREAAMDRQIEWIEIRLLQHIEQAERKYKNEYLGRLIADIKHHHINLLDFMHRTGPLPEAWFECARQKTVKGQNWLDRRFWHNSNDSVGMRHSFYTDDRREVYLWAVDVELPEPSDFPPLKEPTRLQRLFIRKPDAAEKAKLIAARERFRRA